MPPRSSWKGFLRLSLVSVPVKAYTANSTGGEIHLNQLHAACHNRVRYQKTCPEHGELKSDEIVSGYEHAKGQYVIVDTKELEKLRTESDKCIDIDGFLDPGAIDALYHAGKTYYLVPDGAVGQKPYALLREVMKSDGLVAVAQVVLSGREQLVMLRPLDELLVMTVLNYGTKVKQPDSFHDEITETSIGKEELTLTRTLVDASKLEDFDYSRYKDVYVQKLTQLIETKVAGEEVVAVPDPEAPKILNLMDALKQSVAQAQARSGDEPATATAARKKAAKKPAAKKKASAKKMAPSAARRKKATGKRKSG